ncbi:aldehyde dehydrogenase family protein [Streptomyces sp. NPDC002133]|uniref:aldehyde dehydrogenase family protein n=1 Tax=Streptomyces sp. NPDC002133 TaxID=3154409 RepID=UPI003329403D
MTEPRMMPHTQAEDLRLDEVVARARGGEHAWAATSLARRRELLRELAAKVAEHSAEWVQTAARIKQLPADSPLVGEEWISGPWSVINYAQALADTLRLLDQGSDPLAGYGIKTAPGGRTRIEVLPHGIFDKLLLNGFRAEVWTVPGVDEAQLRAEAGLAQRDPATTHGAALVLGAGNLFSIAPLDVLHQLFACNRAVVLKLNPITDPLLDVFEKIFASFIDLGVVGIITGGAETGAALAQHAGITTVHMTGGQATHDAIVWGVGQAGADARAAGAPQLTKPITSELGGVGPVIVVPGTWSKADLRFQAEHVATQRLHNSGFNCVAAQVVVVSSDWPQKGEFVEALRTALAQAPARPGWYPGCETRVSGARALHPAAEAVGGTPERTLLPGLDATDTAESAFTTEYFGPVLGLVELPGAGADFLDAAVTFANERLYGTLGANIVVHPSTAARLGPHLDQSVADLRYGTVGINAWTGVGYLTPRATWGAFPGHTLQDVQSGIGVVHNALLLDRTERTVVRGPFRPAPRSLLNGELALSPKPAWFVTNRTAATTGRLLTAFSARPRWTALPAIFASALRG